VRGLAHMVEGDGIASMSQRRSQLPVPRSRRLEEKISRNHVGYCVEHAIIAGNRAERCRKIERLTAVVSWPNR
jgi:hypothetical protein